MPGYQAKKERELIRSGKIKPKYLHAYSEEVGQIITLTRVQERRFQTNGNSNGKLEGPNNIPLLIGFLIMNLIKIIGKEHLFLKKFDSSVGAISIPFYTNHIS